MIEYACTLDDIRAARRRIADAVTMTAVRTIDVAEGRRIHCKCENLQVGGAFKLRGATNAVLSLADEEAARGVVTHSSGNHAQALARAAKSRAIPCTVIMPRTAPALKREATLAQGARVIECEPTLQAREEAAARVIAETGAVLVPPYDDPRIIAGQGTVGLELHEQVAALDTVVVPVGGGGLLAGTTLALRAVRPGIRIVAAEPAGADDALRSKESGELIPQTDPRTIADGLLTSLGRWTWPVLRDLVDEVVTVSDDEIVGAMRRIRDRLEMRVEPSGAVAVAVALRLDASYGNDVAAVISGGNIDPDRFDEIVGSSPASS